MTNKVQEGRLIALVQSMFPAFCETAWFPVLVDWGKEPSVDSRRCLIPVKWLMQRDLELYAAVIGDMLIGEIIMPKSPSYPDSYSSDFSMLGKRRWRKGTWIPGSDK